MVTLSAFATTLPVIILVLLGSILHKLEFFHQKTITDLKKLVVNLALPMVLINAFGEMHFQVQYLLIVAFVFAACLLIMLLAGKIIKKPAFLPYVIAGFEAGMLGYAVYTSLYGIERVREFAIIDLGQVLFVFFVLVPALHRHQDGVVSLRITLISFLRTPVILAILSGIMLNLTGLYALMNTFPLTEALLSTTQTLAGLTMPLAALVLGYELNIQPGNLRQPFVTALMRLVLWLIFAFLLNTLVIRAWLGLGQAFVTAVWFMFILPPPFVVPLFLQKTDTQDRNYILNTISISTIFALVAMIVLRLLLPQ